jgi:hypothetical protein
MMGLQEERRGEVREEREAEAEDTHSSEAATNLF